MMKKLLLAGSILCCCTIASHAQQKIDTVLKARLERLMDNDQRYRPFMFQQGPRVDSLAAALGLQGQALDDYLSSAQNQLDSLDLLEAEDILVQYGYPGPKLVGHRANVVIYYVIQHSASIGKYYPVIEQAANAHKIPFALAAMMYDRLMVQQNKEQRYGTQVEGFYLTDSVSGAKTMHWYIWPVENRKNLNKRREKAGFKETIEQYAEEMSAENKDLTLTDIERMRMQNKH
jgi:hypothetical protein